jgi:membrane protein DedA with SNARE-associated domain
LRHCHGVILFGKAPMANYLSAISDFVGAYPNFAFVAVFLLAMSEAVPVIGTVVPGSTLILAISTLATHVAVSPWPLVLAAVIGAIIGDGLSFWLGQRYQRGILLAWPLHDYPQFIVRSEAFIAKHGVASVFLARFTAVVRAFVPLIAGILKMPSRQFYAANILSALVWAPMHVLPGVLLALAMNVWVASTSHLGVGVMAGIIVVSVVWALLRPWLQGRFVTRS